MKMNRGFIKKLNGRGFTLIEIMAVVMIIALLGTFVAVKVIGQVDKAKLEATKVQVNQLSSALDTFKMDSGFYPSTEQGLEALASEPQTGRIPKHYPAGGYLNKKVPKDPWDNPYNYREPGVKNANSFDLWSNGPDGQEGTEDDITNWQE